MTTDVLQERQQSAPRPPGSWKLGARRAMTLAPNGDGLLRVARGNVWATFDGPHLPLGVRGGDLVVEAGETVFIAAGERVVIEAGTPGQDAYFYWDLVPETRAVPVERWRAVLAPWHELQAALVASVAAAGRLVLAIAVAGVASLPRRWPSGRVPA